MMSRDVFIAKHSLIVSSNKDTVVCGNLWIQNRINSEIRNPGKKMNSKHTVRRMLSVHFNRHLPLLYSIPNKTLPITVEK